MMVCGAGGPAVRAGRLAGRPLPALLAVLAVELALLVLAAGNGDLGVAGNAGRYVGWVVGASAAYFLALWLFERVEARWRVGVFWVSALVFRVVAVAVFPPCDDLWRYIWEGRVQLAGENPYVFAPAAPQLAWLRDGGWARVNQPDWAAVYPPGAELLFRWLAAVALSPLVFKAAFALADLLTVYLVLRLNTGSGRYRAAAWYAWHPAVVALLSGAGHFDAVMVAALAGAVWAKYRANPLNAGVPAWGWSLLSAVFLGCAVALKGVAVVLLPVWAFALGRRAAVLGVAVAIPYLLSLPYGGPEVVSESLRAFLGVARFNDLVWWWIERVGGVEWGNRVYHGVAGCALAVAAVAHRRDWRRGVLWSMGLATVLSPVLHPWYCLWILPVAAWTRARGWFVLAASAILALLVWEGGEGWAAEDLSLPVRLAVGLPPLAVWIWEKRGQLARFCGRLGGRGADGSVPFPGAR